MKKRGIQPRMMTKRRAIILLTQSAGFPLPSRSVCKAVERNLKTGGGRSVLEAVGLVPLVALVSSPEVDTGVFASLKSSKVQPGATPH